jgi:hypothetical protein
MIVLEHIEVYGFRSAIRGMRNPMNSWYKSDSRYFDHFCDFCPSYSSKTCEQNVECFVIGDNDLALASRLANAGDDHGKFLRQIVVSLDINAPLYWWKEFDTYKVGTVANSCSTMHKIHAKVFTMDDFSHEHLIKFVDVGSQNDLYEHNSNNWLGTTINQLNLLRKKYSETKDKEYWYAMIQLLPSSYNQKRTVTLNYAVLRNMYHARKQHRLDEWREFCKMIENLPYAKELIL